MCLLGEHIWHLSVDEKHHYASENLSTVQTRMGDFRVITLRVISNNCVTQQVERCEANT